MDKTNPGGDYHCPGQQAWTIGSPDHALHLLWLLSHNLSLSHNPSFSLRRARGPNTAAATAELAVMLPCSQSCTGSKITIHTASQTSNQIYTGAGFPDCGYSDSATNPTLVRGMHSESAMDSHTAASPRKKLRKTKEQARALRYGLGHMLRHMKSSRAHSPNCQYQPFVG